MTTHPLSLPLSDDWLVAYLDNELTLAQRQQIDELLGHDPQLASRLAHLDSASLSFSAAFSVLLTQAPVAELTARLNALPITESSTSAKGVSRRALIAAAVSCLVIGAAGGHFYPLLLGQEADNDNWRELVAQYMSLYTRETFDNVADSTQLQQRQLQDVGNKLGLPLERDRLLLPGAELMNARLLNYENRWIAQISYLDARYGPLALCISVADDSGSHAPEIERRRGMNVVYWSEAGHNFMLIGHNPADDMQALARRVIEA